MSLDNPDAMTGLAAQIKAWGLSLGFQQVGITDTDLSEAEAQLDKWLGNNFHGSMDYMQKHGHKRSRPALLHPGTQRVISVRMDYLPEPSNLMDKALGNPVTAYISRYALGRDYHKLMRNRLQKLADLIHAEIGEFGYRAFVDSAPVLKKPWRRKRAWAGSANIPT